MKVTGRRTRCTDMAVISTPRVLFILVSGRKDPCTVVERWYMLTEPRTKANGAKTKCTVKAVTLTRIRLHGKESLLTAVTRAKFKRNSRARSINKIASTKSNYMFSHGSLNSLKYLADLTKKRSRRTWPLFSLQQICALTSWVSRTPSSKTACQTSGTNFSKMPSTRKTLYCRFCPQRKKVLWWSLKEFCVSKCEKRRVVK